MAEVTITGLPNAATLTGAERVPMDQAGTTVDASAQAIADLATAATVGLGNVNNTSDASKPISTATQTALDLKAAASAISNINNTSDLAKPISTATQAALDLKAAASHTQAASTITGLAAVATTGAYADLSGRPGLAAVATSGVYTDLTGRPTLGTAAPLDVPATGDASGTQVVKGNDSRLSDARTPAAHNQAASTITGLAAVATSGSATDLTTGTLPAARIPTTTVTAGSYTNASVTVDAAGRLTAASSGAAPVTSVTGTEPIVSSGGTTPAISISAATTGAAGSMSSADKSKLDGVASGATANATDATLLARGNHTGTQAFSTITGVPCEIGVACSDETTALTTGTGKVTFRMPYAMTLTAVRLNVNTAVTVAALQVDLKESGTTVFSTQPQVAVGAKTSVGGAVPGVINDSSLASDAEMTIDIVQPGGAAKGLKVWLIGTRA